MAKTQVYALGKDAVALIEGSSAGFANLVELVTVNSCKVTVETTMEDTTCREGDGEETSHPTTRKRKVDVSAKMKVVDAVLQTIEDAAETGAIIEAAFLTGPLATAGSRGPYAYWTVASFARDEPVKGIVAVEISFECNEFLGKVTAGTDPS